MCISEKLFKFAEPCKNNTNLSVGQAVTCNRSVVLSEIVYMRLCLGQWVHVHLKLMPSVFKKGKKMFHVKNADKLQHQPLDIGC